MRADHAHIDIAKVVAVLTVHRLHTHSVRANVGHLQLEIADQNHTRCVNGVGTADDEVGTSFG